MIISRQPCRLLLIRSALQEPPGAIQPGGPRSRRHTLRMAVRAFHEVDVVRALHVAERGVHLLDVQTAIGEPGMARGAGGARGLRVMLAAGQTTGALVHTHRRARFREVSGTAFEIPKLG